ncbi:MAG: nucleotide exchange factor GrpE [Alphaproteobacteria bacterium]|nr:nucleotide exchange factor GrpE [Alphaproteobacteria bacterium]
MKKDKTELDFKDEDQNPERENCEEKTEENLAVEDELENLRAENAKLKDDYLRAYADLENTKKRCALDMEKQSKYAISAFAKDLLSVADNLHRALTAVENDDEEQLKQFKKGVELTEMELMKVLNKFGITKMEAVGNVFDPAFHQVVQEVEDKTKPAGTIVAELQTGYMINGRLLREAMVIVSR